MGDKIGFKTVQLFRDQILGSGIYGKVYKAECDGLLCAAKLMHESLFHPDIQYLISPQRDQRQPLRRFQQECEYLSSIRHPNIIQYLGMYQDPDTCLPVLLMELMDDSLTHFLESSPQPIAYHIQVNICHDIALALSFLHSNGIIHRDLSSNNMLMISNIRAKVTDDGMLRLGALTPFVFTLHPGSDVYIPPEAVKDKPVCSDKVDCFSFGVITLQIMTQLFPQPGDRQKELNVYIGVFDMRISERERWKNHISRIDPNHPLLAITLECVKDKGVERPSAEELCRRLAYLKQNHKYSESVRKCEEQNCEVVRRVESLRQQHAQQIVSLEQKIQSQVKYLEEKDQLIKQKDETIAALDDHHLREQFKKEKEEEKNRKDNEILKFNTQLKAVNCEKEMAQARISELESQLRKEDPSLLQQHGASNVEKEDQSLVQQHEASTAEKDQSLMQQHEASNAEKEEGECKLKWRKGKKAMCKISNIFRGEMSTTVNGDVVYVMEFTKIFAYNASTLSWSQLPDSEYDGSALAIVKNLLTLIGGRTAAYPGNGAYRPDDKTNKLFGLTEKRSVARWTEEFPPMPTKRCGACALSTELALIVAGGSGQAGTGTLATTEVLNTATLQWSTIIDLPQQMFGASLLRVGSDSVYLLGAYDRASDRNPVKSVYTCSLNALLRSYNPQTLGERLTRSLLLSKVWRRVTDIPAVDSSFVSFHDQLLAIGGKDSSDKPTTAVYMYHPSSYSWQVVCQMAVPRRKSYVAVLPDNQLIVIGGLIDKFGTKTDAVEITTIA